MMVQVGRKSWGRKLLPATLLTSVVLAGLGAAAPAHAQFFSVSTSESDYNHAAHDLNSSHPVNVLYGPTAGDQSGNTVTGYTQPQKGGIGVTFTSPSLLTSSGGQADVDIAAPFSTITLMPTDPTVGFDVLEFRPEGKKIGGDPFTLSVTDQFGNVQTLNDIFGSPNQDFFGIIGLNDSVVRSATLTSSANIGDIRQVRVNAVNINAPGAAVPEPASLALLGLGALPLGLVARRRLAGGSKKA